MIAAVLLAGGYSVGAQSFESGPNTSPTAVSSTRGPAFPAESKRGPNFPKGVSPTDTNSTNWVSTPHPKESDPDIPPRMYRRWSSWGR
jgi:hypothetical protein